MVVSLEPRMPIWVSTKSSAAIAPAFIAALFQLGGLRARSRGFVRPPDDFFCSSAVSLRPVRPRASIEPAALPRCLVRLLRFVWAMEPTRVDDLRAAPGREVARLPGSR